MISTGEHRRGFVRAFGKRYPASGQKQLMQEHAVNAVYNADDKKYAGIDVRANFLRTIREGDVACIAWLCVLSEPLTSARKKRADLMKCVQVIEDKGAIVFELGSGRRSSDRKQRDAMIADAYEALTTGRVPRSAGKLGRPPKWTDAAERKIVWDEWHSTIHKSNSAAAAAASERLGRKVSAFTMWRIVREMRVQNGITDKGGRSGRAPGPSFSRFKPNGKRVRQKVYFIRRPVDGAIKIGTSCGVPKRHQALQHASPDKLTLLATIPGDESVEGRLHLRFQSLRIKGEWFRPERALLRYIKSLPKCTEK